MLLLVLVSRRWDQGARWVGVTTWPPLDPRSHSIGPKEMQTEMYHELSWM